MTPDEYKAKVLEFQEGLKALEEKTGMCIRLNLRVEPKEEPKKEEVST